MNATQTVPGLIAGIKRVPNESYRGVVRLGKKVIWTCPHHHVNRDSVTPFNTAAYPCALETLEVAMGGPIKPTFTARNEAIQKQRLDQVANLQLAIQAALKLDPSLTPKP